MRGNRSDQGKVSVVVPVHNGGGDFARCLDGIFRADPPADEVVVVVDGPADASGDVARRSGARVVELQERGGPGRARNHGVREAQGDVILFIDADVVIAPDCVGRVRRHFAEDPDLAAVFGSYDDAPGADNFLSQYKNLFHHYTHQTAREEASTFWSGCGAIRRDLFLAIGGYDERYRCIEDIELGYRLTGARHRIRLDRELQGKHLKRWTVRSLLRADIFCRALPWTALLLEGRPFVDDLNLRVASRLSVALVLLGLVLLPVAVVWPVVWIGVAIVAVALLGLNARLYTFFLRRKGLGFTALAVLWHWFYFLYGGAAFAFGAGRHYLRAYGSSPGRAAAVSAANPESDQG